MTVTIKVSHIYRESVENVAATHLAKYPNKYDPNVLSCNITEKKILKSGELYTRRIATCKNVIPNLFRNVPSLNTENINVEEECTWNKETRTLTVHSRNLTWRDWITMREHSFYGPHKYHKEWTLFHQEGSITVNGLGKLGSLLELFGKRFLASGAHRSIKITECLLSERNQSYFKDYFMLWYSQFMTV